MSLYFYISSGFNIIYGIVFGNISGLLFSSIMTLFVLYQAKKFKSFREDVLKSESIIIDGGANHFYNKESVGGWLIVANKYLYFKSHNVNIQNHALKIPTNEIANAKKGNLINSMIITLISGNTETFVVNGRKRWINEINNLQNAYPNKESKPSH